MTAKRAIGEIWHEPHTLHPWRVQLRDCSLGFQTRAEAECARAQFAHPDEEGSCDRTFEPI